MVRYVMMLSFTEVGASQIQNTTRRAQMFHAVAEQMGVRVESLVWTLGEYDAVAHVRADEEDSAIALSAHLARQGYVRARLLRALTEEEFARVLSKLPGAPIELDG